MFKHLFSLFTQAFGFTLKIQQRPAVDSSHLPEHIHPVIRQIYAHRGINHAADIKRSTKELLHYQQLRGVNQAVELLHQSMLAKKQIMIVGDFDADAVRGEEGVGMLGGAIPSCHPVGVHSDLLGRTAVQPPACLRGGSTPRTHGKFP